MGLNEESVTLGSITEKMVTKITSFNSNELNLYVLIENQHRALQLRKWIVATRRKAHSF